MNFPRKNYTPFWLYECIIQSFQHIWKLGMLEIHLFPELPHWMSVTSASIVDKCMTYVSLQVQILGLPHPWKVLFDSKDTLQDEEDKIFNFIIVSS